MSDMGQTLVTRTAQAQILALDDDGRDAVDAAIENLSEESGEPIELPAAPGGAAYLAMKTSDDTPVVIYRAVPEGEGGGWLILSLMSPDEYKDVLQLQEFLTGQPGARTLIEMTAGALRRESPAYTFPLAAEQALWRVYAIDLSEPISSEKRAAAGRKAKERLKELRAEAGPVTHYRTSERDRDRTPEAETAEAEDEAHRGS
jgi:hypothetical protein